MTPEPTEAAALPAPTIERVRHELKRRTLTVERIDRLTPAMLRVTFTGPDLVDFTSLSPDDHCKIFLPVAGEVERRDYTPRQFDAAARRLAIDFAVHDAGPATRWALAARPGDTLEVGGPRGSAVVRGVVRSWLLIGDETALPAIGRRIEELPAGCRVTCVVAVAGAADQQTFATAASLEARWVHRPPSQAANPTPLLAACRPLRFDPGTFVWIAAEATVARALRTLFVDEKALPRGWIKAAGYWAEGRADAHEDIT